MTDMKPIMGLTHKLRQATDSNVSEFVFFTGRTLCLVET